MIGSSRVPRKFDSLAAFMNVASTGSRSSLLIVTALFVLGIVTSCVAVVLETPAELATPSDEKISRSLAGAAPDIRTKPLDPYPATAEEAVNFTFIIRDNDSATVNLTWDWGDGTVEETNVTGTPGTNIRIYRIHAYYPEPQPGRNNYNVSYLFNLTVTDPDLNYDYEPTKVVVTVPIFNSSPGNFTLSINETIVDPSASVYIMASAVDAEGEALTWTFKFNDSVQVYEVLVFHTPVSTPGARVWNNFTHVFGTIGTHKITMNVSDALVPYQVWPHNVSKTISVQVAINNIPQVSSSITTTPTDIIVDTKIGYALMNYSIQAFDLDGDVLTVTWDFGDGTPEIVNISAGGTSTYTFRQTRNYTDGGVFNVTVNVTDGRPGHDVIRYKLVTVLSTNLPPFALTASPSYYGSGSYGPPGEPVNFTLVFYDAESNTVEVMIDFGDGSPKLYANLSDFDAQHNVTFQFQHVYEKVGNYTVLINYTDNRTGLYQHHRNVTVRVDIYVPPPVIIKIWDWWDYTSLSLLGLIPVVVAARMILLGRRRKELEQKGMTLEEWKLVTSEIGIQEDENKPKNGG